MTLLNEHKLNCAIKTGRCRILYGDDDWKMSFFFTGQTYRLLPIAQISICLFDLQYSLEKIGVRKDLKA